MRDSDNLEAILVSREPTDLYLLNDHPTDLFHHSPYNPSFIELYLQHDQPFELNIPPARVPHSPN